MEENQITIVDEKGNEHLCEIIFTFDAENLAKIIRSLPIGEVDEDGDQIYDAMAYEQNEEEGGTLLQSNLKKSGKWYKKCSTL